MNNMLPILLVIALVFWTAANQRLQVAAQPVRLKLAEKGEKLLSDSELSPKLRQLVEFMLDSAFGHRTSVIFGLFAVPVIAAMIAILPARFLSFVGELSIKNSDTKVAFEEVSRLHDRVMLANHPLLTVFLELEILLFVPLGIIAFGLIHGRMPEKGSIETVKAYIETSEQSFRHRFAKQLPQAA